MILKFIFDRVVAFLGLCFLWPVILGTAILVKVKMGSVPFSVSAAISRCGAVRMGRSRFSVPCRWR